MKAIRSRIRFFSYLTIALVVIQIGLMYKWNWFCFNFEPYRHVYKMCSRYKNGLADGLLCAPLCESQEISSLTCRAYHMDKEAVFDATWGDTKLVFKSAVSDIPALHWYDNGALKYPTEKEFLSTIRAVTRNMLNYTLSSEIINKLIYLQPKRQELDVHKRHVEMDNIWVLIQNNEYVLSKAYLDRDLFPQILGTCGSYFSMEYIQPIPEPFSIWFDQDTKENWNKNIKYSIQIMELLEELDNNFKEPLHVCDVKLRDFGTTHLENGRAKILDLDTIFPRPVIHKLIGDIESCDQDEDCKFFDCRGRCNKRRRKCDKIITNNNLQRVCEKIFLGWRIPNTILLPGLLLSKYAPPELMSALRQCANPEHENRIPRAAAPEDLRKHLYSILLEMEQADTYV